MKIIRACKIFENIDSNEYTTEEKAKAIYLVTEMFTHNSITKASMMKVIKWLFNLLFEVSEVTDNANT